MKTRVVCGGCGKKYSVDSAKIPSGGTRIKCPNCKGVIVVNSAPTQPADGRAAVEAVVSENGGLDKTQDFFRLFMVPGMDHCSTVQGLAAFGAKSIGLDDFDALTALENWVEKGIAPDQILASGQNLGGARLSRPLYPYPLYPKDIGGDPDQADSFMADNDGSVRWNRFRKDSFYSFAIPSLGDMPLLEGEGVNYFQPYDHQMVPPGVYEWQVWSPSMFDGVEYDGFNGVLEKD